MAEFFEITQNPFTIPVIEELIEKGLKIRLSAETEAKVINCRNFLDDYTKASDNPVYGINTGFGSLYNRDISKTELERLQENLVMSHACGVGEQIPNAIVKLILLLKIKSLALGHSGIQLATLKLLIEFYNRDILPVVYSAGSLGASGDLAPLAHLALPLLGKGEVMIGSEKKKTITVLKEQGLEAVQLKAKEGLALLNGTQFMSAFAVDALIKANRIMQWSNTIASISLDAFDGRIEPFDERIHTIRKQHGQLTVAKHIRSLLEGSEIIKQKKQHVQDPYSFRCIPQVHGATYDALEFIQQIVEREISGVTDNPNIFPETGEIISGGNFHGQPLAINLDYMGIAVAELANISERRTYQLVSGSRGLPDFLIMDPGLNSGLMIPQYSAASLVSQNKQLCTPASVDSIVSSNGQEDHVSMGANAATKLYKIMENTFTVLAIELICASQAIQYRRPLKSSYKVEEIIRNFRPIVSLIENDRILHDDIMNAVRFLKTYKS